MNTDEKIGSILGADPLDIAEKITGTSYKDDSATVSLGMVLMQARRKELDTLMAQTDDTVFSNDTENYLRIVRSIGFQEILKVDFTNDYSKAPESLYVFWHDADGILLKFDTYDTHRVNGGKFYYNWRPNDQTLRGPHVLSSGSYTEETENGYVWAGDHDCREALRFHIRQLKTYGTFVKPWIRKPFLWLLHYVDTRSGTGKYDFEAINNERIVLFPENVRKGMGLRRPRVVQTAPEQNRKRVIDLGDDGRN